MPCSRCPCDCYYCHGGHNSGARTCVFGHSSTCMMRVPFPDRARVRAEREEAAYQPKHMKRE